MSNRHTPAKLHQQAWVIFVNCLYCTWCCFACSAITHKNSSQLRSFNLSICKPCVLFWGFDLSQTNKRTFVFLESLSRLKTVPCLRLYCSPMIKIWFLVEVLSQLSQNININIRCILQKLRWVQ